MKMPISLIDKAEKEYSPGPAAIREIRTRVAHEAPAALEAPEQGERRRRMIEAVAPEDVADALERSVGLNDLVAINYLLIGYLQSRSVGRICYFDKKEGKGAVATGFLISDGLVMTNHHVFPVENVAEFGNFAKNPTIEFNHEYDIDGNHPDPVVFELDPERFLHTFETHDLALIGVRPTDKSGAHELKSQGYLVLNGNLGKARNNEFATIIQHPAGREKQIAIRKNEIINTTLPDAIVYVSDTAQGSSGAPVFNDQWQVIALHSAGVPKKDGQGRYLDKDGQVIEPVNGKVDGDRIVWESNRGIRVSTIMGHLAGTPAVAAHPLIQTLFSPAYTDSRPFAFLSRPTPEVERATRVTVMQPPAPAAFAMPALSINIQINPSGQAFTAVTGGTTALIPQGAVDFEKKYEDELDLSDCAGFDANFMGVYVPMPVPGTALRKKLAFLKDSPSAYSLKYHHYSTIHHAVRRVPIVSGINVHGKFRYAELNVEGSRVDKWYRDNRLDYDVQLDDEFYKKSGFDKGHLARREDAEWGTSVAKAKLAADLTCSYGNAVPQVPALNRAVFGYKGKWGQLELELLEQGVRNEASKSARICVFNGPLFDDNEDPVFKSVQVALNFYKVVVWWDGAGKLKTTCFRLSQKQLVGEIEFEVLRFDEVFKTSQIPIGTIEEITGLKFHDTIVDNDTSDGNENPIV